MIIYRINVSRFVQLDDQSFVARVLADELVLLRPVDDRPDPRLPRWAKSILDARLSFVRDVIATPQEICLCVNDRFSSASLSQLASLRLTAQPPPRRYRLPVRFCETDEPSDWLRIEQLSGLDRASYERRLIEATYTIAMLGFLPGFVYLAGLPAELHCPRLDHPVRSVPAGSLAVGGPYLGVYGRASPAGWNVVGQVAVATIEPAAWPPVGYLPGDEVILESLSHERFAELKQQAVSWSAYDGRG